MTFTLPSLSCRKVAVIALTIAAIAVCACSTNMSSTATPGSTHNALRRAPAVSWSQWITVRPTDQPPGTATEVAGINNLVKPEIVGFYTVIRSSGNPESFSFTSQGPSYSALTYTSYPRVHGGGSQKTPSKGTQMNAIETTASKLPILAGWVSDPGDQGGTFPVVYNQGLWALENNGSCCGTGMNGVTAELFGINDSNIAVGFTAPSSNSSVPEANYFSTGGDPIAVPFPSGWKVTASIAYGINDAGDMVGTATMQNGPTSWYALCISNCPTAGSSSASGSYCWMTLNNGQYTSAATAYAISGITSLSGGTTFRLIVGSYTDGKATHGFLVPVGLTSSGACETGTFQTVDVPNSDKQTVVRGVNNAGYIVGYYTDNHGRVDGFVGIPSYPAKRRR
jgi:hypothetical protein